MEVGLSGKSIQPVDAILQARLGSTRFPAKVMAPIVGKPLLFHIIERVGKANHVKRIILATTELSQDDALAELATKTGILCFRGEEKDVLSRFYEAARQFGSKAVLRVCCDNPITDPAIIDKLIEKWIQHNADYASTSTKDPFPLGMDLEVFTFAALEHTYHKAKLQYEREHVTPFIYNHPELFRLYFLVAEGRLRRPDLRLTVDTEADMALIRAIYERLYRDGEIFHVEEVVELMNNYPEMMTINSHIRQKKLGE